MHHTVINRPGLVASFSTSSLASSLPSSPQHSPLNLNASTMPSWYRHVSRISTIGALICVGVLVAFFSLFNTLSENADLATSYSDNIKMHHRGKDIGREVTAAEVSCLVAFVFVCCCAYCFYSQWLRLLAPLLQFIPNMFRQPTHQLPHSTI